MDSDISPSERPEENGKPSIKYWISQLQAAKAAAKPSQDATSDAWREYVHDFADSSDRRTSRDIKARYPIYWASIRTMQPAIYGRTPQPAIKRTFDDTSDPVARVASLCLERLASYLMNATPFDRIQYATRDEFLHGGRTTNRVYFNSEIEQKPQRVPYFPQMVPDPATGQPVTAYFTMDGAPAPDGAELQQDEQGIYAEVMTDDVSNLAVELCPIHYTDILHTPSARHHEEIEWIAYRSELTREDVRERFGDKMLDRLSGCFSTLARRETDRHKREMLPNLYLAIWEVWNKRKREVYWLCEKYPDSFIDMQPDPYELSGFFPSPPFMLGTCGPDSLYPVPDYVQLEPLIKQLHAMAERFRRLVLATRRRGVYDKNVPELKALVTEADEGEFIGIGQFAQLISQKGGLANIVQFFPVEPLVSAIQEMAQVADMYEQKFNEIYGIPDILRGVSDPTETAAAQQLKGQYTSLRFSSIQREFQRLVRDDLELMCDLALKMFPSEKLAELMGVRRMSDEDKSVYPQALALLQNDAARMVRIDIETDSTTTMNENNEIEQRNYLSKTLFEAFGAIAQLAESSPALLPVALQTMLYAIRGLRKGEEIEGTLEQAIQQMIAQGPPQQPQGPPDYTPQKLQLEQMKVQSDAQIQQQKLILQQAELRLKAQGQQVEMMKVQAEAQDATARTGLDTQIAQFSAYMDQLNHQLESYRVQLDEQEKYATEARLQREDSRAERESRAAAAPASFKGNMKGNGAGGSPPFSLHIGDQTTVTRL